MFLALIGESGTPTNKIAASKIALSLVCNFNLSSIINSPIRVT